MLHFCCLALLFAFSSISVNDYVGFGLMDASRMVDAALNWTTVPPKVNCTISGPLTNRLGKLTLLYFFRTYVNGTWNELCLHIIFISVITLILNKNVVFPAQAEYSYLSADFRLKIFLYFSKIFSFWNFRLRIYWAINYSAPFFSFCWLVLPFRERNKLKTYNCIGFTDIQQTKLYPFQNLSLGFILIKKSVLLHRSY